MSNSPLVSYSRISPNRTSPRNHVIDTITIHCVVGQCSVESLGAVFAPRSCQASSNYGIGYDGRIGMYCEEKDRSFCSSNAANDHRAITIEVASDTEHPYAVTDKAYAALIDLCVDICTRNGIKKLLWKADRSLVGQVDKQNMTVHRWFYNKSCPGKYLYDLHGKIAKEVNVRLGVVTEEGDVVGAESTITPPFNAGDVVKITGQKYYNGQLVPAWVRSKNWIVYAEEGDRIVLNKSQDGLNAIMSPFYVSDLELVHSENDFSSNNVTTKPTEPVQPVSPTTVIKKGDVVSIAPGAKYFNGKAVPAWVVAKTWIVASYPFESRVMINKSTDGKNAIMSHIDVKYLTVVKEERPCDRWTPKVGDIVYYNGDAHYASANATKAIPCKGGQAKITRIYQLGKSKHPYHLVRTMGKGASVYGWVDEGTFTKA